MDRVLVTFLALILGGVGMSLILSRFITKKWLWYVPSLIGIIIILYFAIKIEIETLEGFQELGYLVIILMLIAFTTGNLLTNVFVTIRHSKSNRIK
jgi:hypothetical protein